MKERDTKRTLIVWAGFLLLCVLGAMVAGSSCSDKMYLDQGIRLTK